MALSYCVLERQHIEWARKLHNDSSTLLQLTDPEHVTESQQEAWFTSLSLSRTSKRYVVRSADEWVGVFRVDAIDHKNKSVMVGLDIDPIYRGRGLSYAIYEHFLDYFFNQCGMNRVYLKVLATNERAIHIYTKLGFTREGVERQAIFRDGQFRDYICMSILRDEYDQRGCSISK